MKIFQFLLILPVTFNILIAADNNQSATWADGSALIIEKGQWEIGLFNPLSYGFSETIQISTHPLVFLQMPNVAVKKQWITLNGYLLSSKHSLYYPTPLLNLIAKEGIGGFISPEFEIPAMISTINEIIVSKPLNTSGILSLKLAFAFSIGSTDLDQRTSIDLPLLYQRLSVYHNGHYTKFGADYQSDSGKKLGIAVDIDYFILSNSNKHRAFEHKGLISYSKKKSRQILIGYKYISADYPFGQQQHLFPIIDLCWKW
ncbi:MAG: hypothetical protein HQ562_03675 [Candidatus Marinimicrobia bacterium]|nr:hypothetical protein [Candidatus Neomarinimicrobiota bacterium]